VADEIKQLEWTKEISQALLAPFPSNMVEVREGKFFFIDARAVQSRLDETVGPGNWEFDFEVICQDLNGVAIKGRLTVLGVTKCEAGEHWKASDRDKIEVFKAAVSDALKRCAVQFGIGRYLYELEVARAGQMTQAERDAAARKVGYLGSPEVHDFPCSTCGADVDIELARKCQRTYGGRVFCVKHKGEMDEGIEAQKSVAEAKPLYASKPAEGKPVTATKCSNCPRPLTQGVLTTSTRIYGKPLCFDCQKEESKARVAARPLS
jgi:hypothetical protein